MDLREQIEQYAFGKLSGDALRDFEARLAADPAFADAVARESEMLRALRIAPEVDLLREQLNLIEKEHLASLETNEKQLVKSVSMHWYLAAAAAVLLTIVAIWFFREPALLTPEQIFAAHFNPPKTLDMADIRRGNNQENTNTPTDFQQQWAEADSLYARSDFKTALQIWQRLAARPEARDFSSGIHFYTGLTAMQAGDFRAAISFFEKIPLGYFQSEKPWYVALCQLRVGNLPEAREGFIQIAASDSPFAGEAREILARLSR